MSDGSGWPFQRGEYVQAHDGGQIWEVDGCYRGEDGEWFVAVYRLGSHEADIWNAQDLRRVDRISQAVELVGPRDHVNVAIRQLLDHRGVTVTIIEERENQ